MAEVVGVESVVIDTALRGFKQELRRNEIYYHLAPKRQFRIVVACGKNNNFLLYRLCVTVLPGRLHCVNEGFSKSIHINLLNDRNFALTGMRGNRI